MLLDSMTRISPEVGFESRSPPSLSGQRWLAGPTRTGCSPFTFHFPTAARISRAFPCAVRMPHSAQRDARSALPSPSIALPRYLSLKARLRARLTSRSYRARSIPYLAVEGCFLSGLPPRSPPLFRGGCGGPLRGPPLPLQQVAPLRQWGCLTLARSHSLRFAPPLARRFAANV
jgi:hypothetical protein